MPIFLDLPREPPKPIKAISAITDYSSEVTPGVSHFRGICLSNVVKLQFLRLLAF